MKDKKNCLSLLTIAMVAMLSFSFVSCGGDDDDEGGNASSKANPLPQMDNVSLNYRSSSQTVSLPRDVQAEGATVSLKKGVSWINQKYSTKSGDFLRFFAYLCHAIDDFACLDLLH